MSEFDPCVGDCEVPVGFGVSGIAVVLPGGNLGYIVLSATMIAAALIELIWGVAAERRPLEDVARPLTFVK
jgi:hypothetical protein